MEVIEPLFQTVATCRDLLKAHKELAQEFAEMQNALNLISIAIRPLRETTPQQEQSNNKEVGELAEVMSAVQGSRGTILQLILPCRSSEGGREDSEGDRAGTLGSILLLEPLSVLCSH